jgi:hypothetical protein
MEQNGVSSLMNDLQIALPPSVIHGEWCNKMIEQTKVCTGIKLPA